MAFPNLVVGTPNSATYLTSPLSATAGVNGSFSVANVAGFFEYDASGVLTNIPLGTSGPFVLLVKAEQILCSSQDGSTFTIYQDGSTNGRAFGSTSIVAHGVGKPGDSFITVYSTSVSANTVTTTGAQTLTNKRIVDRVQAITNNPTTVQVNTDLYDVIHITAQTATIVGFTLTGSDFDGDQLRISITGTGSVPFTLGPAFEASTVALPTTTTSTARLDMTFYWNTETGKFRLQLVA